MSNYLELKACCAYQAELPTAVELQFLASCSLILELKSSSNRLFHKARFFCCSTLFLIKAGFLSLKIFTQTKSNNEQTTNPIAIAIIIETTIIHPVPKSINGIKNQQVKNRINRIFGKFLAYVNNCSWVVCHSLGTLSGNVVQTLSLFVYKVISKINAIIGYKINGESYFTTLLQNKIY